MTPDQKKQHGEWELYGLNNSDFAAEAFKEPK
jgi:hypothetical protein